MLQHGPHHWAAKTPCWFVWESLRQLLRASCRRWELVLLLKELMHITWGVTDKNTLEEHK